jgi:hypothetical protein
LTEERARAESGNGLHAAHTRRTHASTRKRKWDGGGGSPRRARDGGWPREADARRGRVGWSGTARRAALHMRESTHPTAMYARSLALAALALAGSLALGAANEPAGRAACRTRHCAVGRWGVPSRRAAGPRVGIGLLPLSCLPPPSCCCCSPNTGPFYPLFCPLLQPPPSGARAAGSRWARAGLARAGLALDWRWARAPRLRVPGAGGWVGGSRALGGGSHALGGFLLPPPSSLLPPPSSLLQATGAGQSRKGLSFLAFRSQRGLMTRLHSLRG